MSLCRNGHDLDVVGKWVETPTRPLHMQCTTCRRAQRVREHAVRRQDRAIARLRRAREAVEP